MRSQTSLFLIALATWCVGIPSIAESTPPRTKIGVVIALSGPLAPVGNSLMNAVKMADAKFDPDDRVEFLFEDDQFQAKQAVTAAEKLINQDGVKALLTFSGATSGAVAQIAERRHIPLVAVTGLREIGRGKRYVFVTYLDFEQQLGLLLDFAKSENFKRIAVITNIHESMLEFREYFVAKAGKLIVSDEEINPGDSNLNTVVTRMLAQKPDAITLFILPPQISAATRLFRDQGFTGQFLGGPPLFNPPEIKAAHGAMDGALLPGPHSKGSTEFLENYAKLYHQPCISEGLYGYDAASLLLAAAHTADIATHLQSITSFDGLLGSYPKTEANIFAIPAELKRIGADGTLQPR